MRRSAFAVVMLTLIIVVATRAQSAAPKPPPEVKKWAIWAGDWTTPGTAKDSPSQPEYKLEWRTNAHWILGGFALQVDGIWRGNGTELHSLEILSYDPAKKANTFSGFQSDGTTWIGTATFNNGTSVENVAVTDPNGKVAICRNDWVFSADGRAVSGKAEFEQDGGRWTNFTGKGTRVKGGT